MAARPAPRRKPTPPRLIRRLDARCGRPRGTPRSSCFEKAGMSSGLREVTRPWSVTTSWSTHSAPALRRSVCSEGQEVILAALHPAGIDQRPGPVADRRDRLPLLDEMPDEGDRLGLQPQLVGVDDAAGQQQRRVGGRVGLIERLVHRDAVAPCRSGSSPGSCRFSARPHAPCAPAAFSAFTGSVSSTCSTPSVARTATCLPFSSSAMALLLNAARRAL